MSNYTKGYYAEQRTREHFERDGYVVFRPGGSFGPADLVAAKPGQWLLVQVKTGEAQLQHGWWNDLFELAALLGADAIVADWPKRGQLRLRRITGLHIAHKHDWPCEPFFTDEVAL